MKTILFLYFSLSPKKKSVSPSNREDFIKRLETFEFGKSSDIPLSPLFCVKKGWNFKDSDILQCLHCMAVICTSLPSPTEKEACKLA